MLGEQVYYSNLVKHGDTLRSCIARFNNLFCSGSVASRALPLCGLKLIDLRTW